MSAITTYILDSTSGRPASGISAILERKTHTSGWQAIAEGVTDANGRINNLLSPTDAFLPGHYRFIFETGPYFLLKEIDCFFPQITVSFVVKDAMDHYHLPLLLSPFGYTAYRAN